MRWPTLQKRPFDPDHPEWMDDDPQLSDTLRTNLRNLQRLNAHFGAYSLAEKVLCPLLDRFEGPIRWLDLATGLGDIPCHLYERSATRGIDLRITAVDAQPATLTLAREYASGIPIEFIEADLFEYEPAEPFDIVTCFLALHHFSTADAHRLLQRMLPWGKHALLVADLERSPAAIAAIDLLTAVWMREPETRHDATLSIRQSFTFREFGDLATLAGWCGFDHQRHPLFRQAILLA